MRPRQGVLEKGHSFDVQLPSSSRNPHHLHIQQYYTQPRKAAIAGTYLVTDLTAGRHRPVPSVAKSVKCSATEYIIIIHLSDGVCVTIVSFQLNLDRKTEFRVKVTDRSCFVEISKIPIIEFVDIQSHNAIKLTAQ